MPQHTSVSQAIGFPEFLGGQGALPGDVPAPALVPNSLMTRPFREMHEVS